MVRSVKDRRIRNRPKGKIPDRLLIQIGRVATVSAYIEQEIILWASALFAQNTDGKPIEPLRMEFGRLRQKWYGEAVKKLDKTTVDKFIQPLNMELARVWPIRGMIIHGRWQRAG